MAKDDAVERAPGAPRARAECVDGPRPCPWVGCRYHLALSVTENGSIKSVGSGIWPVKAPRKGDTWEVAARTARIVEWMRQGNPTCALDEAELGGMTLETVPNEGDLTRQRINQIERGALKRLEEREALREVYEEGERLLAASRTSWGWDEEEGVEDVHLQEFKKSVRKAVREKER